MICRGSTAKIENENARRSQAEAAQQKAQTETSGFAYLSLGASASSTSATSRAIPAGSTPEAAQQTTELEHYKRKAETAKQGAREETAGFPHLTLCGDAQSTPGAGGAISANSTTEAGNAGGAAQKAPQLGLATRKPQTTEHSARKAAAVFAHLGFGGEAPSTSAAGEAIAAGSTAASVQQQAQLQFATKDTSTGVNGPPNDGDDTGSECSSSSVAHDDNEDEELYFQVAADAALSTTEPVEQDIIRQRCTRLRSEMRARPCLPPMQDGQQLTDEKIAAGVQLPLYSCPWRECYFSTNDRARFIHHVAAGVSDLTHKGTLDRICGDDCPWMSRLDYVHGAVAHVER